MVDQIQKEKSKCRPVRRFKAEQAERQGDYGLVAEIRYGKIKQAEENVLALNTKLIEIQADHSMVKEVVDAEDIADVVSRWTGIPVTRMIAMRTRKAAWS